MELQQRAAERVNIRAPVLVADSTQGICGAEHAAVPDPLPRRIRGNSSAGRLGSVFCFAYRCAPSYYDLPSLIGSDLVTQAGPPSSSFAGLKGYCVALGWPTPARNAAVGHESGSHGYRRVGFLFPFPRKGVLAGASRAAASCLIERGLDNELLSALTHLSSI